MHRGRAADVAGRGTLWLFAARLFFMASGLVVSVLLARGLGPADFGLYGLAISLLTWTQLLVNWAVPGAVARLAPAHGYDPRIAGTATTLLLGAALLLYALVWLAAPMLERVAGTPGTAAVVRLLFLDLLFLGALAAWQAVFLTHGRLGWIAATLVLQTGVKMVAVALLFVVGLDIWRVILAHLAGSAVAVAVVALRERLPAPTFMPGYARALTLGTLPLLVYMLVYQFQANVGVWWVAAVRGADEMEVTGQFTAATQVARILTLVPSVLSGVLFARVAEAMARNRRDEAATELVTAVRYALLLLLPALAAFAAAADRMVALLYGPAYGPAADMLRLLALAGAAVALMDVLLHALMGAGRPWLGPLVAGLVLPAALGAGLWLVPWLHGLGVAAALAAGSLMALAVAVAVVRRRLAVPVTAATLLRVSLASAALYWTLKGWRVSGIWLLPQFGLLGLGYFGLLWAMREFDSRDLALLRPSLRAGGPG